MLSINGVHLENDLGLHLLADSSEPILPDVRENTVQIPGRHGEIAFDSYLGPRKFFERILIPSQATLNDVQKICREIGKLLLDADGKPKKLRIEFDYEPDKFYFARFTGYIAVDRIAKAGLFPIPLTAYDPYAYASLHAFDIEGKRNPGYFDWMSSSYSSISTNHSYYNTPLIFTIDNAVTNPSVINLNTGERLDITYALNAGEKIIVNGLNYSIYKVETEYQFISPFQSVQTDGTNRVNLMPYYSGTFPQLVSGENELLFEGTTPNATVRYEWLHRFL